ncbi:hypothetical protein QJS10_CPB13g00142 [Acorus calamus]|uniref:Uncharacterized protein n=1 Tax=Acorus calamus TaxID=4465 RepID=A0AAV9DEG8_ACOCL|nr:hypothetical protein QJS10_CPB13g00142 [Acorus calamus]
MCFQVDCTQCGKVTWTGCGKHVPSVYSGIEKGRHCTCRPWPGVVLPADNDTAGKASSSGKAK